MKSLIYILAHIISVGTSFAIIPILTRYLSKTEYGQLSLLITVYTLFVALLSLGFPAYIYRSYMKSHNLSRTILVKTSKNVFVWSCIIIALSTLFLSNFELQSVFGVELSILTVILLSAFAKNVFLSQLQLFVARNEPLKHLFYQILYSIIFLSVTVSAIKFFDLGMVSRILGVVISDTALFVLSVFLLVRFSQNTIDEDDNKNVASEHLKFGLNLIPHLTGSILLATTDKLIISAYIGPGANADYTVASQFVSIITVLSVGLGREWSRIYMTDPFQKRLTSQLILRAGIVVFFAGTLLSSTPFYYLVMASDKYDPDYVLLTILLMATILNALYALLTVHFTYTGEVTILSRFTLISLCINGLTSISLVAPFGLIGVGIGTLAGMLIKFLGVAWYFQASRRKIKENK